MTLPVAHTAGPSTALGGGFVNCMATVDTDSTLVTLHGAGLALAGGDVWGKVRSAPDALRSGAPGGLLVWQSSKGNSKGKQICGLTFSRVQAGRCYAFHGSGDPSTGSANSGYVAWSDDGLNWHEIPTGQSPSNFQHANPRGVGQVMLSRAVSSGTKDQIIIAGSDGVYVSQDVTAGTSNAGMTKVALGASGSYAGLVCVGLDRDPNNPDTIYVAARDTVGNSALQPGLWKIQINSSGSLDGTPTLLVAMAAQEVCAINETSGTAVYCVGKGGIVRYKGGTSQNFNGGLPTAPVYSCVDGFNSGGFTTLAVANLGNPGQQIFMARFADSGTGASWTALDVPSRIGSFPVYGQPSGDNYWAWQPGGKKGTFALGVGSDYTPSQIIVIQRGGSSCDIYVAGRSLMYALIDAANGSSQWQVSSKGTNASVANVIAASPFGSNKMAHGDLDFLITTTQDSYTTVQPRIHQPTTQYFYTIFYDEKGGLYLGSSDGPSTSVKTHGNVVYHPSPHDTTYSNTTNVSASQPGGWTKITGPGSGQRVIGVFACWPTASQRVLIATVVGDHTYRRVDTVSSRDANGNPTAFNTGAWTVIPNLAVGVQNAPVVFARGSASGVYCLDPTRGLCRSDDNGVTWAVIDASFTGSSCDMDNDPATPDRLVLIKSAGAWVINDAKNSPGTKAQILSAAALPSAAAICFDMDSSQRTGSVSRCYVFNNAPSGANGKMMYSDNVNLGASSTWTPTGGPSLANTMHTISSMCASNGTVAVASQFGGIMIATPNSAFTDTTPPSPNPPTNTSATTAGPSTATFYTDTATDAGSGVRGYQFQVSPNGTSGWVNVGTESPDPNPTITDTVNMPAGATRYPGVIVTDNNGNPTSRGVGAASFTLPATPGSPPTMLLNSVQILDPTQPTLATADITGSTTFDTGTIDWGDGDVDTIDPSFLIAGQFPTHLYAQAGTYSVAVTGTNAFGISSPVSLQFQLVLVPSDTGSPAFLPYVLTPIQLQTDWWPQYNATLDLINSQFASLWAQVNANTSAILALQGGSPPPSTTWSVPLVTSGNSGGTGGSFTAVLPSGLSTGKAYAFVQCKGATTDAPTITGTTGGWTMLNPAGVANGNGADTMFVFEHTVASGDSGQTLTVNGSGGAILRCGCVVVSPEASGRDTFAGTGTSTGFLCVANSGTTASGSHATPTPTPAGTNRLLLFAAGGRFSSSAGRTAAAPSASQYTQLVEDNTHAGDNGTTASNNMFMVVWYLVAPTAVATAGGSATTQVNAFSVGAVLALVHS